MSFFVSLPSLLVAAIALSAVAAIVAEEMEWRQLLYVAKPLATLLVLLLAWLGAGDPDYRVLVITGLVFSLAGDVFLMLPKDRFVAGLVSFLVAHLAYVGAFTSDGWRATPWIIALFAVYAAALLRVLQPRAGTLKVPVAVYAAVLTVMAWQAVERGAAGVPGGALAAAGAALFVLSDSALAIDRFVHDFRHSPTVVLGTYFAAQTLIALSVHA